MMTTTTTLPERQSMPPQEIDHPRESAPQSSSRRLSITAAGTRNGWAMRAVYVGSDLAAFAMSLAIARWIVSIAFGIGLSAVASADVKLAVLWLIGLTVVAAAQQTYAAIPPRPVRKFRG